MSTERCRALKARVVNKLLPIGNQKSPLQWQSNPRIKRLIENQGRLAVTLGAPAEASSATILPALKTALTGRQGQLSMNHVINPTTA